MESHLGERPPLVIPDEIRLVVLAKMTLQRHARSVQRVKILMLQQKGDAGLTLAQGITNLDFVGVGNIPDQVGKPFCCLPRAQMARFGGCQLHYGDHVTSTRSGVPAFYQLTRTFTRIGFCIDLVRQLFFGPL